MKFQGWLPVTLTFEERDILRVVGNITEWLTSSASYDKEDKESYLKLWLSMSEADRVETARSVIRDALSSEMMSAYWRQYYAKNILIQKFGHIPEEAMCLDDL